MSKMYFHVVLNSLVVSWIIHMFLNSVGTDPGMAFTCVFVFALLVLSFPGYVRRHAGDEDRR